MGTVADVSKKMPISWKISNSDSGTPFALQDLGSKLGINLKRVKQGINGRHVAVEFGFGSMYASKTHTDNIVDTNPACSVELTLSGMVKIKAPIDQIAIHKAGAHARIVVDESDIKVASGRL